MAFHQEKRVVLEELLLGTEWSQLLGTVLLMENSGKCSRKESLARWCWVLNTRARSVDLIK